LTSESTVFHIEADASMRGYLSTVLQGAGLPVESYDAVPQFLQAYNPGDFGCLIMDIQQTGQGSLSMLRRYAGAPILLPIILLTAQIDVEVAAEAINNGVVDFLEKPCNEQALLKSVRAALQRDAQLRQAWARHQQTARRLELLSPGESDVVNLIRAGKGYKNIAAELRISYKTVESRRAKVMRKMVCDNLAELLVSVISYEYWLESRPAWETAGLARRLVNQTPADDSPELSE
jgi:two-component system response regulator FixJ